MTDNFIGERFSQLREARNVSARKMSLDLGHSTSYMNAIEAGRKLPSLSEFPASVSGKAFDRQKIPGV